MIQPIVRLAPRFRHLAGLMLAAALSFPVQAASLDDLLNAAKLGDGGAVVQMVQKGMDVNSTDAFGNTLLILAAREDQPKVVMELLQQRGIKLDARNSAGDTALMLASLRGYTAIARQLIAAGASMDHAGWNPLLYAAFEGRPAIVETLLAKGANPNAQAPNQTTPLMFAARNGHEEVVVQLIKAGADLEARNDQNETAESWALKYNNTDIAELIRKERAASR
ncbi:ankyrin repeat domain-containing protein [Zoogloea sp.]|uniref:ankyrin repeat domain-containing protein n=1 Tax=Zoogloea sp. TaxID=49181 RepID=UPI002610D33F|nr:ankyrin repeat domain-containing protein [Zoogloea sp.]MDD3353990.1 ankyrin repeat domain-containing protein [Zoogloea sp.]